MVSTPIINVNYMDYYSFIDPEGTEGRALTHSGRLTREVVTCQP